MLLMLGSTLALAWIVGGHFISQEREKIREIEQWRNDRSQRLNSAP